MDSLIQQAADLKPAGLILMALAGLLAGVAPGSYPLLAAGIGLSAPQRTQADGGLRWRAAYLAAGFVLAIAIVDALVGGLMGLFGFALLRLLNRVLAPLYFLLSLGLLMAGLAMFKVIRIDFRVLYAKPRAASNFGSAFALGVPFGLSTCPACTPLVLPVLIAAVGSGDALMGSLLLFVFGLARGVPIVAVAFAADLMQRLSTTMFWMPAVERVLGILLLMAAAAFAYQGGVWAGWFPIILN